jgi:outer membrane protein assembly factor BamB
MLCRLYPARFVVKIDPAFRSHFQTSLKIEFQTMKPISLSAFALLFLITLPVMAENWPNWRGPHNNGTSDETNLPTEWSSEKNVAWKIDLPGAAGSTPAIWEDRIFLTSTDGTKLLLMALDTNGKELWRQTVAEGNEAVRGDEGNYASPSPVTDGEHVWSFMGEGTVGCYDFQGKEVWKMNLQDKYGKFKIQFGLASTPVLYQDRICFQLIHGDGSAATEEATVVALDKTTGNEIWVQKRITKATQENEHSYASPVLYDFGGTSYLITHGADFTVAYELDSGKERWRLGGLNPHGDRYHPTLRFVASPSVAEGIVVIPTAKDGPVFAIRADLQGDLTGDDKAILWIRPKNTPDVPTPLIDDELVYLCRESGQLLVLDRKTGEEVYYERTHNQRYRSSPVMAGGHIYLTARDGYITVVKPGREFKVVAENKLDGESITATPAISNGTIYLRTFDRLFAIRN